MPARQRSTAAPEPITKDEKHSGPDVSSPQANAVKGATKKDIERWHGCIRMVESDIAQETNANRLENMRAVLAFVKEHGYPDGNKCEEVHPEFCIWAMDGEVKCSTDEEFMADPRWRLPPPGFKGRANEGYCMGPPSSTKVASAPSTEDLVAALFRQFEHDLKTYDDNEKKANIHACIAYLKSEGIKAVPKDHDHVLFAHKGVAKCMSDAEVRKLFTDPKTKAEYVKSKDKIYCAGRPYLDQKMAGSNKDTNL
ncbi:hypothetical protein KVR01_007445 [Diaporthe batatas]|uniref:uncharacterized protein n=1 Tax=Diaporthe batatas TaxID=748121 RepID=UPI001D0362F8|nr:uncharacterized protein KVR01_007445 [Diaporthe batatas]KAG8162967.1 hypothetical protein KVR01_007445 [Diaporthe batatas]